MAEAIKRRRAYNKGLITHDLNSINSLTDDQLNIPLLEDYIDRLEANLVTIEEFDASMSEALLAADLDVAIIASRTYHLEIRRKVADLKVKRDKLVNKPPPIPPEKVVKLPLPPVQISSFENNTTSPFAYFNFKKAFINALAGMPNLTQAQKFLYLKGYLVGEALIVVENIPVTDDGYALALQQLDFNFLDKENIIDRVLNDILQMVEVRSLLEVEPLVRTLHTKISDLNGLGVNLLETDSAALLLLSKIVNKKLPRQFLIELARDTGSTYPNFNQLLCRYHNILARLSLGSDNVSVRPKVKDENVNVSSKSSISKGKSSTFNSQGTTTSYSKPSSLGKCRLCLTVGHTSSKCSQFDTLDARKIRAASLNLCVKCLSDRHHSSDCPGNKASLHFKCFSCNKAEHHGAMCPQSFKIVPGKKILSCQSGSDIFVPVLSLPVSLGKKSTRCVFLLDTGAQFSIINKQLVEDGLGECYDAPVARLVASFGMPAHKSKGFDYGATLRLPSGKKARCLFFAVENFHLQVQIPMLPSVVANIESAGYVVSPDYPGRDSESVVILGILGNDVLQNFSLLDFNSVKVFDSYAKVLQVANGVIPFGSVSNFIHPSCVGKFYSRITKSVEPWVKDHFDMNSEAKLKVDNVIKCHKVNDRPKSVTFASKVDEFPKKENFEFPISSRVFYNSSLSEDFKQNSNVGDKVRKPLVFVPPKDLGNKKLLVNFAVSPIGYQFDPLQEIFPDSSVEYGLDSFYNLESIGIKDDPISSYEQDQVDAFAKSISFSNGHYNVVLPFKRDLIDKVPSNLKVSLAVAERVYSKLENQNIIKAYEAVFDQQEKLGIIEPVEKRAFGQIWIPHRPVIRTDDHTTTKIRPVFNCSLKVGKAPSLNEAAFPGVDMMNGLLSLLLHFRTNDYVILADIMKAFLQIRLSSEADRNRFCFFRKVDGKFVPYRYNTIIFGFVSSPFILNYIIQYHLSTVVNKEVSSLIRENFYVDNIVLSTNQGVRLPRLVKSIKEVMQSGGLPLREWGSNCPFALTLLDDEEKSPSSEMKVLGYLYNVNEDTLQLKFNQLNRNASTKRQILSSLSTVFDPVGIFAPILLQGKLIIRKLCQQVVDWDQQVDSEISRLWSRFCTSFEEVSTTSFFRKSFSSDLPVKLFMFADASKEAYGCAIYAVQGEVSSLVFSKVKVSPLKERTLPTLELLAAQLALKCFGTIFDSGLLCNTKFECITLFVDSQVVLSWILKNKAPKKNIFVNNRLKEILSSLEDIKRKFKLVTFAYVPSNNNQADLITKPCSARIFLDRFDDWVRGPSWLTLSPDGWPKGQLGCIPCSVKGNLLNPVMVPNKEPLVNICEYSSFSKLIGVVTKFFTAVFRFKKSLADPVSAATNYLMKTMQEEAFPLELDYLSKRDSSAPVPLLVSQLNLFIDEQGVIRSKGRIEKNVELKFNVVNPILMPKHHHLTKLLIYYAHCKSMHMGLQFTLNFLRMHGLWVLKARQAVSSVLKDCIVCKRYNASTVKYPSPASLPSSRVNLSVPFAHTGVDYTGHLWLREENGEKSKAYILIFTCFNTRAVHLEAVQSMTTSEFILAFIRFSNRYGIPSSVYSDNAKSFVQAGNIIEQLLTSSEFEEKFRAAAITHRTIPIYAAWYGAVWERLIKTVKHCLFKTLGRYTPSMSEFVTFLSDIQKILNNRPLTYRSFENELDIISPNHFLVGRSIPSLMFGESEQIPEWEYGEEDDYSSHLARTLETRDALYLSFKNKWLSEYLVNLREKDRATFHVPRKWEKGEVALFKLPSKARSFWPLVRVEETYSDDDGVIRTVLIVKPDGSRVTVNVGHLIPLELYLELNDPNLYDMPPDGQENLENSEASNVEAMPEVNSTRPSRSTALASRAHIRSLAREGRL